MRIVSWNVNGLRACHQKGFCKWIAGSGADVVSVQEVRALHSQIPTDVLSLPGWHSRFVAAERPGYSGVGILSRRPFDEVLTSLEEPELDVEGRLLMGRLGKLWVVSGYFPQGNGKNRDLSRIPYKLRFYDRVFRRLQPLVDAGERVLVMGDFNTAHQEIDLARPKDNREASGFRPEERAAFARWLEAGWVDTFRRYQPEGGHYTWWSQRFGVRARNVGWRIDYVLASPAAVPFLRGAATHPETTGSDHCPVSVEVDEKILGVRARPRVRAARDASVSG